MPAEQLSAVALCPTLKGDQEIRGVIWDQGAPGPTVACVLEVELSRV